MNPGDLSWDELKSLGEVVVYDRTDSNDIIARAADADAVLVNKVVLDEKTLKSLPKLKYVGVLATGYNVVDVAAAAEYGVTVTNIPAYSTDSVVQMTFATFSTSRTVWLTMRASTARADGAQTRISAIGTRRSLNCQDSR